MSTPIAITPIECGQQPGGLPDAPDTVQRQLFGELPADPVQAEQVAKTIIQSPDWQQKQQQIGQAYRGVLQAYSLKLAKYPAVVFDDRYVVFGTADVAVAEARLAEFQGRGDETISTTPAGDCAGVGLRNSTLCGRCN